MDDANSCWDRTVELFESGAFWEAHEVLEPYWLEADGLEREFAAGVILLCAALHKARAMGNSRGGRRNYAKALRHLALVPDTFHAVAVRTLEADVHRALVDPTERPRWPGSTPRVASDRERAAAPLAGGSS
ncbi:hypothetical protein BH23DEI1_BH23DEI1_13940 [soil metagenome]